MDDVPVASGSAQHELMPLQKAKTGVWDYCGFPAQGGVFNEKDKKRTTVFCKLCPKHMPYQGSTTNMMAHLQYHHPFEFKKAKEKNDVAAPIIQRPKGQPSVADAF